MNEMDCVEHLVRLEGDRLMTDTLTVAKSTNKRHDNVLRAYDNLQCSAEFSLLNFEESDFVDERGKLRRLVKMTKDGFMLLVMGFSGEVAMAIKEAYIAAFNALATYVARHQQSLWQRMLILIVQESESKGAGFMVGLVNTENATSSHSWPSKHRLRVRRRGRIVPYPASPDGRSRHTRATPHVALIRSH
jgi:Rha family phage regulatory protein